MPLTQNQLGRSSANIQDQASFLGVRQGLRHALIDQPRFFPARDDVNRKSQQFHPQPEKLVTVPGFTQSLCGDSSHLGLCKTSQSLAKAGQAVPSALHRQWRQVAVVVKPVALTYGLFEVFGAVKLAVFDASNFKPEAVGT